MKINIHSAFSLYAAGVFISMGVPVQARGPVRQVRIGTVDPLQARAIRLGAEALDIPLLPEDMAYLRALTGPMAHLD